MTRMALDRQRITAVFTTAALLLAGGALMLFDANPAASQTTELVAREADEDPGLEPGAEQWASTRSIDVPLTAQQAAYSAGGGAVEMISARALHYDGTLYVRLEWDDDTPDASTLQPQAFSDAAAVQFPAETAASVPSICMGQANAGVNIWHWRADSEAGIDDPDQSYVNAMVDLYPATDLLPEDEDVFYTARAAGNPYAQADMGSTQNLVAQAFGTLTYSDVQEIAGRGTHEDGRWAVVFSRPFEGANPSQASFEDGTTTDVAFAVWDGSNGDRNGQKSVSSFINLRLAAPLAGADEDGQTGLLLVALGIFGGLAVLGVVLSWFGYRQAQQERG